VFLRDRGGETIGPLSPITIEVLFGTRVIDETTPISRDGVSFQRFGEDVALLERAVRARNTVLDGGDPWRRGGSVLASPAELSLAETSPLAVLFRHAAQRSRGRLTFASDEGEVTVDLLDGKVVVVDTTAERLGLGSFLLDSGKVALEALDAAVTAAAERFGGDVGAALIGLGKLPPHEYVELYAQWARGVLADVIAWSAGSAAFAARDVKAPPMPLGLDRAASLVEAARHGLDKAGLELRLAERRRRPLIPSSVDGLALEDLRLPPKELRIIKAIDGTRTLDEVLAMPGADTALAALYATVEGGFVVSGEDLEAPREREAARQLEDELRKLGKKSALEIMGVKASATDEEVHARYMTLAKLHHPDRLRPGAAQVLVDARRQMFAAVQAAYEATQTADKRQTIEQLAALGVNNPAEEQAMVRAVLEAETLFKKAEILARVRKYSEALELLEQALLRKPDDIEFRVHRAYFRHMARRAEAEPTLSEILTELKKQPALATGHLFVARLSKSLGKVEQAQKAYKKVLELDPRNHEAESELRLASMRKDKQQPKKKWL
jgi:curved DNA-binding protein CbpA